MRIDALLLSSFLTFGLVSGAKGQQGVDLTAGLIDFTTWNLYGDAVAQNFTPGNGFTYSNLVLTTQGIGGRGGAGFAPGGLTIDFDQPFNFNFNFFIAAGTVVRGDGLTFTLAGTPGVGQAGSGLGYEGLGADSVAFAVDTFHFTGEPVSPSLQILQAGSVTPLAFTETGLGDGIRDPLWQWRATVSFTPSGNNDQQGTLTASILRPDFGSFAVSAAVNLSSLANSPVYYGFTASNGLADDGHYVTSAVAVPEPGSWALLVAGLVGLRLLTRRRRA